MPGEDGSGAAMRTPALGKLAQPSLAGLFGQRKDAPDLNLDGEIAGGPDVGAPFGEQKIDLGGPTPYAFDGHKLSYRGLVSFS